jgi:short-subunit dehydrogenase
MKLDGVTAVVTGAARGLGRALAVALAARGARLALVGRDERSLEATAAEVARRGPAAHCYGLDLTRYQDGGELVRRIAADLGSVDLLVCNAATGTAGAVADLPLSALEENLDVNVLAPAVLAQECLRLPLGPRGRTLCFILSGAGYRALPAFSAYSTGKAALGAFADALRIELHGSGVNVLTVVPGTMDTEFAARMPRVGASTAVVMARRRVPPERVAARIVRALEQDRQRLFVWGPARIIYHLDHLVPGLVDRLLARLYRRGDRR